MKIELKKILNQLSSKSCSDGQFDYDYPIKSAPKHPCQFFLDTHTTRADVGWWRKSNSVI